MDADFKNLKKMTAFMRKQGLLRVKTAQIELELSPSAILHEDPSPTLKPGPERDTPIVASAEELSLGLPAGSMDRINWSSPGYMGGSDS